MAITQTTLSADLGAGDLTMTVASGTGFPAVGTTANPGYIVRIDGEYLRAIGQPVAGTIKLRGRGSNGTTAAAHDVLAKVEVSSDPQDFGPVPTGSDNEMPPFTNRQETIGEDITFTAAQVLAWGNRNRTFAITKGSAALIGLPAPSKAQDGLTVTFTSLSAFLHVLTATTLLANGGTASPYTTATGAHTKVGATLVLQAQNGLWNVVSASNFTIT